MTLVDAGPLVAIIDKDDQDHGRCTALLVSLKGPLVTSWPAFAEAMYLLNRRGGWKSQEYLWRLIFREDLKILPLDEPSVARSRELMEKYHDLPMDLADATLVAIAEKLRLRQIFTLDTDFHVYRLRGGRAMRVLP